MKSTVLIVDDEQIGRETLHSILEGTQYHLEMAEDGHQALEKARETQPDVILLDVMMPGLTGFDVCKALRNDVELAEIPIIMITALDDRESLIRGLDSGADDYITKPFDRYELRARLSGITRLNRYRKLLEQRINLDAAHQELITAYDATIEGWSKAMELRDRETKGHILRVTEMTLKLAEVLGIDEDSLTHIRRGALLHDMGKLGIPDSILHKPGPLTDKEWEIMRTHPLLAVDMLSSIEYLSPALDIPHYHHERWDGTGYPDGLKGVDIPIAARIFAVVDVWDALYSDRPYRAAWDQTSVLAHIRSQAGQHFDPDIVPVFLETVNSDWPGKRSRHEVSSGSKATSNEKAG